MVSVANHFFPSASEPPRVLSDEDKLARHTKGLGKGARFETHPRRGINIVAPYKAWLRRATGYLIEESAL